MIVRLAAAGLIVTFAAPALAPRARRPSQSRSNSHSRRLKTIRIADPDVTYEEQVVVTASRTEEQLVNAPAAVSVVTTETIQNSPATNIGDLLRGGAGRERDAGVGARRQHHDRAARRRRCSTSQLALVDGRSVLPRFLRHGDVGPRADQSRRDPADRSDSRPGVGGLGRQRHERRRQRHHADRRASWRAQGSGTSLTIGVGVVRPQRRPAATWTRASLFYVNGSHARSGQRSLVVQACRRVLHAGSAAASRPGRFPNVLPHAVSGLHQRGHDAAEVRRARRLRHREQRRNRDVSRAASRARRD